MSDAEELIFTEDDEAVVVETGSAGVEDFLDLNDQQRLVTWATLSALPQSATASSWMNTFAASTCDEVLTSLLENDTVSQWADGNSDIINRAISFLGLWFSGGESEQGLKVHWRNLTSDQQDWASFLEENMEGGGGLREWGQTVGKATDVSSFTSS